MNIDVTHPHFEDRNAQAELKARNERLDRDRVISAALDTLDEFARRHAINGGDVSARNAYLVGATGVLHTSDVLSIIDDVKRSLSPLVR